MVVICLIALANAPCAVADTVLAARTIRAQSQIGPDDITLANAEIPGALSKAEDALGKEARSIIYAGRPIHPGDLADLAVVERNAVVELIYRKGALVIFAEGRALGRGPVGARINVMNLASRTTVLGTVLPNGSVRVGPNEN